MAPTKISNRSGTPVRATRLYASNSCGSDSRMPGTTSETFRPTTSASPVRVVNAGLTAR